MQLRTDRELFEHFAELAWQAGRPDVAGECLRRATSSLQANNETAEQLHQRGIHLLNQNQLAEAEVLLARAIHLNPAQADWHDHLAVALARQKRLSEAEVTFRLARRLNPQLESVRSNLIQCLLDQKKLAEAQELLLTSLEQDPGNVELELQLSAILPALQQSPAAIERLRNLSKLRPDDPRVWNRLGVLLGEASELPEAEDCFRRQIQLDPTQASGYANLAAALGKQKKWHDAVEMGRKATQLEPNNPQGWANLGNAYRDIGQLNEAVQALTEAVRRDPNSHEAAGNLALTIAMMARPAEALPWYDHALKLKPDAAEIRFNRAIALLWMGDYDRGWIEYEWRWLTEQMRHQPRKFNIPVWDGSPLRGKTILVHAEQGHGDTIQFARFLPRLTRQGARVIFTVPPALATLIQTIPDVGEVLTSADAIPVVDVHSPLMSLPGRLGIRLQNLDARPYLQAPTEATIRWSERVNSLPGRRIGLAWQGNPGHIGDRFRSIPLKLFEPLMTVPGVSWVSLQKGAGQEQLQELPQWPIQPWGEELTDFADTAGLLANLDLLISVDTATVHVMGALGKPVWPLLAVNNDWRWLLQRSDSPWYPSATLFRQSRFGDWPGVIEHVRQALLRLLA